MEGTSQTNISAILRWILMHAHVVTILVTAGVHVPIVDWKDFETDPTLEKKRREFVHEAGIV